MHKTPENTPSIYAYFPSMKGYGESKQTQEDMFRNPIFPGVTERQILSFVVMSSEIY